MKNEPLKDFASNEAYGNAVYFPHFFLRLLGTYSHYSYSVRYYKRITGLDGTFLTGDSGKACSVREPDLRRRFLKIYKLFQAQSIEIYIVMLRMLEHLLFNLCFDPQLSLHCV